MSEQDVDAMAGARRRARPLVAGRARLRTLVREPEPRPAAIVPPPCPECGAPGYLDHIDLRRETQSQHCRACRHVWSSPIP
jgi:hypothetical protein